MTDLQKIYKFLEQGGTINIIDREEGLYWCCAEKDEFNCYSCGLSPENDGIPCWDKNFKMIQRVFAENPNLMFCLSERKNVIV